MKRVSLITVLVLVTLIVIGCGGKDAVEEVSDPGRPSEPAAVDGDYRPDSPSYIAATGNPQLIEFFAYWCTVCRGMKPTVHSLEAEYWEQVDFIYLDIDDPANSDTLDEFAFVAQPLFVLITADGEEVQRWYGSTNADDFRVAFDNVLGQASR